jgi:hypothetical protein
LGYKWIIKKKLRTNGSLGKYQVKLVAKGYDQVVGLNYHETFLLMIRMTTIKLLLALTAMLNCKIQQMDVKIAFLIGDLNKII